MDITVMRSALTYGVRAEATWPLKDDTEASGVSSLIEVMDSGRLFHSNNVRGANEFPYWGCFGARCLNCFWVEVPLWGLDLYVRSILSGSTATYWLTILYINTNLLVLLLKSSCCKFSSSIILVTPGFRLGFFIYR